MLGDKQRQEAGDNSLNVQSGRDTVIVGLTYKDAKDLALDVFRANFMQLSEEAAELAFERARKLLDDYIAKLEADAPQGLAASKDPDMQFAIYNAQAAYARTGDDELGDLLVNLLVQRAIEPARNVRQIVLNESIAIAQKLTDRQLDTLTLAFIIKMTTNTKVNAPQAMRDYLLNDVLPFIRGVCTERSDYQHIAYTGCASVNNIMPIDICEILRENYTGIFSNGFTTGELESIAGNLHTIEGLTIPCFNNSSKGQFNALAVKNLEHAVNLFNLVQHREKLINLFNSTTMSVAEIRDFLMALDPAVVQIIDVWENTSVQFLELSTVGIALAQANYQRKKGDKIDLSVWIK